MKRTIALALASALVTAQQDADIPAAEPSTEPTKQEKVMEAIRDITYFSKNTWEGMYIGLFGPTSTIEKIDDDCFGDWIPDDMEFIYNYFERLSKDTWSITYEDTTQLAYNMVDLLFLNDEYCHFRTAVYDVVDFCSQEDSPCKGSLILGNLQTNAFGMITQITSIIQSFTANKWDEMDREGKAYTLHQLGQNITGLFVDVMGFHPIF